MTDPPAARNDKARPEPAAPGGTTTVAGRCPLCRKPAQAAFRPFCSKRCADVDLSRWLKGVYAIPVVEEDSGDADEDAAEI